MDRKKPSLTEDDRALFESAVGKVVRLKDDPRVYPPPSPRAPASRPSFAPTRPGEHFLDYPSAGAEEILAFARPGLAARPLRRLRLGQMPAEATLDLHGLTRERAGAQAAGFLRAARALGRRCVLVVHGKGLGTEGSSVLKGYMAGWLREQPYVLAYHSALPRDGGAGALYVLLRRQRD